MCSYFRLITFDNSNSIGIKVQSNDRIMKRIQRFASLALPSLLWPTFVESLRPEDSCRAAPPLFPLAVLSS